MRLSQTTIRLVATVVLAAPFLTACSSTAAGSMPWVHAQTGSPAATRNAGTFAFAILAETLNSTIDFFTPTGKLAKQITKGISSPSGLFVDARNDLWVANQQNVVMFTPGASKPSRTLQDPSQSPADVNVATDGTIYVANFVSTGGTQYGPGSVSVYAPGSSKPTRFLRDPKAQYDDSVTTDAAGNVFTTINDYTGVGYIDEFAGGKQSGFKRLTPAFTFALTIRIDPAGNLLVLDQLQQRITEFTETGSPTGTVFHTKGNWIAFALDSSGTFALGSEDNADSFKGILSAFPRFDRIRRFQRPGIGLIGGVALQSG